MGIKCVPLLGIILDGTERARVPASELRDTRVGLDAVWGRPGSELEERLGWAEAGHERRRLLESAIASRRPSLDLPDPLVLAASRRLGLPGSRVGSISRAIGMSERQLLRRFKSAVGYGPKTLDRVLRLQRFLASARTVMQGVKIWRAWRPSWATRIRRISRGSAWSLRGLRRAS